MVAVLDRLSGEPFYDGYKRRLREVLGARRGSRILDIGAGAGDTARALTEDHGAVVVALDRSVTMAAAMRDRAVPRVLAADGHRLPFGSASFDGVLADRVLQHVADPEQVLDEMVRVLRPGGRIALADPDYGTQTLDIGDEALGRRVLRFRAEFGLRNGTLAHRHAGLLAGRGLREITMEARTLVVRDSSAVDNVMGLRSWAHTAAPRASGLRGRGPVRRALRRGGARRTVHLLRDVLRDRRPVAGGLIGRRDRAGRAPRPAHPRFRHRRESFHSLPVHARPVRRRASDHLDRPGPCPAVAPEPGMAYP